MNSPVESIRLGPLTVWFGHKTGKYPDGNQIIVESPSRRVAFDTPVVSQRIGAAFDGVDTVILGHVHEDHMAGLGRVPDARLYVHEDDVAAARSWPGLVKHYGYSAQAITQWRRTLEDEFHYVERPDAIAYQDGAQWDLGGGVRINAIHMPGHTAGHCVLRVEPGPIAFIGDIDLTGFGPYYGDATSDLQSFRRSIAALPDIDATVWVTSHHRGVYTDRQRMLDDLAAFAGKIDAREAAILAAIAQQPRTLEQMIGIGLMYPAGYQSTFSRDAERRCIGLHLDELVPAGRILRDDAGVFRTAGS